MTAFVPDAVYRLRAPSAATATALTVGRACCVLFAGDQLDARDPAFPPAMLALQSPEAQAAAIAARYPGHDVVVVGPSRLLRGCFAAFDRFLPAPVDALGAPTSLAPAAAVALPALASVLAADTGDAREVGCADSAAIATGSRSSSSVHVTTFAGVATLRLMGFSKGGCVVQQCLAEAAHGAAWAPPRAAGDGLDARQRPPLPLAAAACAALASVHYLDCGLNCHGAFPAATATHLAAIAASPHRGRSDAGAAAHEPLAVWAHHSRWMSATNRPVVASERQTWLRLLRASEDAGAALAVRERAYTFRDEPTDGPVNGPLGSGEDEDGEDAAVAATAPAPREEDGAEPGDAAASDDGRRRVTRRLWDHLAVVAGADERTGGASGGSFAAPHAIVPL